MSHKLYSKGQLLEKHNREEAIKLLARMTHKPEKDIEKRLLNGKRKKIKSSDSLEKLHRLKRKFESRGLDCYIETGDLETNETD